MSRYVHGPEAEGALAAWICLPLPAVAKAYHVPSSSLRIEGSGKLSWRTGRRAVVAVVVLGDDEEEEEVVSGVEGRSSMSTSISLSEESSCRTSAGNSEAGSG